MSEFCYLKSRAELLPETMAAIDRGIEFAITMLEVEQEKHIVTAHIHWFVSAGTDFPFGAEEVVLFSVCPEIWEKLQNREKTTVKSWAVKLGRTGAVLEMGLAIEA